MKILEIFKKRKRIRTDNFPYFDYIISGEINQNQDDPINTLIDVLTECIVFLGNDSLIDIDRELRNECESFSFNLTRIYKYENNLYIMQTCPWDKGSLKVLITRENFVEMFNAWQKYMVELPNYIIITREDNHYSITSADNLDAFETTKK